MAWETEEFEFADDGQGGAGSAEAKTYTKAYPKNDGDSVIFYPRPGPQKKAPSRRSHYCKATNRRYNCKSCTRVNNWGDNCDVVQKYIERARNRKAENPDDPKLPTEEQAKGTIRAGSSYLYQSVAYAKKKGGEPQFLGTRYVELGYNDDKKFQALVGTLRDKCLCNQGDIKSQGYSCPECGKHVTWTEDDRKAGRDAICQACGPVKVEEHIECSAKCAAPQRGHLFRASFELVKLPKGTKGGSTAVNFRRFGILPEETIARAGPPLDLEKCVEEEWSAPADMLAAFGLSADAAQGSGQPSLPRGEKAGTAASTDDLPF